jgi:putative hydrolase of the HAD superfamily
MSRPIVLLDADGVFLRTVRPGNYLEHRYGLSATQMAGFQRFMGQCLVGKADLKPELPRFLEEWGIPGTPEMFLDEAFGSGSEVDESVADVVKDLRREGIFCGLATNQDKHRMQYLDQRLAIRGYFDATFVSCELGVRKPDAGFFHVVRAALPGRILAFWDDRPENVQAAKECGWSAFVFENVATFSSEVKTLLATETGPDEP